VSKFLSGNLKGKDGLGELVVDVRIILTRKGLGSECNNRIQVFQNLVQWRTSMNNETSSYEKGAEFIYKLNNYPLWI